VRHLLPSTVGPALLAVIVVACGGSGRTTSGASQSADVSGSDDAGNADGDDGGDQTDASSAVTESCYGVFHWLQKDAYSNTGGRSTPLWPPHTTTQLDVHCVDASGNDQIVQTAFRDNHGTDPGTVDANGNPFLVEVKTEQAAGSRADLLNLLASYTQCECAPTATGGTGTPFLTLTNGEDALAQQLLGAIVPTAQASLVCDASVTTTDGSGNVLTGTSAFVAMLQNGNFSGAVAAVPSCSWSTGYDWPTVLSQAMTQVATNLGTTLGGYHVCNNDGILEADLWESFVHGNGVVACDNSSTVCQGPTWYYTP
jgi:hypothetical protein